MLAVKNVWRWAALAAFLALRLVAEPYGVPYPAWWDGRAPRPTGTRFDRNAFDAWASHQPKEAAALVDFVRANLQHVSQAEFEAELIKTFEAFEKTRTPGKKLLFVTFTQGPNEPKSNVWATAMIKEKFPEATRDAAYMNLSISYADSKHVAKLKELVATGDYQVVLADDASYSGRQLMETILPNLSKWVGSVDLLIPFTADFVAERLESKAAKDFYEIPIRLHRTKTLPTIGQMLAKLPAEMNIALTEYPIEAQKIFNERHTLTVFDHKTPDFMSFPGWLAEGHVLGKGAGGFVPMNTVQRLQMGLTGPPAAYPFLKDSQEPYKCDVNLKNLTN